MWYFYGSFKKKKKKGVDFLHQRGAVFLFSLGICEALPADDQRLGKGRGGYIRSTYKVLIILQSSMLFLK